ncbi:AAA family ATPase [Curtanaerobium respiraculi]|uniref:AAA family ATPase n=1 Tax=Curtanaerobium respiraculi TaxID=2949669 RepID=UPI0024B3677F|nr:AAA family ATPase [Curtanaerobium respiraculi]
MKQNGKKHSRGYDSTWNYLEQEEQKYEASKYIDQFFCFWEAGQSNVAKAIEFLKEIDSGSRVSVISFSDSKCLNDEKEFLDKPRQYFRALPSFNGLVMVGSEPSRILSSPEEIPFQNQGSYLGSIDFDGCAIELSPQMNAIIGGRGTGKSVLLDSIAQCLGKASQLKKERKDFLSKHSAMVKSMDGLSLHGPNFNCDFFKQNYILSLFEKDGEEFNEALEDYFSDAFSQVDDYEIEDQRSSLRESFTSNYQYEDDTAATSENIAGLIEKYTEDQNDGLNINIKKSLVGQATKELKELSYDNVISGIRKGVMSKLPKFLKENEAILGDLTALEETVAREAFLERQKYLGGTYLKTKIYEEVATKKKEISAAQKDKQNVAEAFSQQLQKRYAPYAKRVALINAYLRASEEFDDMFIGDAGPGSPRNEKEAPVRLAVG